MLERYLYETTSLGQLQVEGSSDLSDGKADEAKRKIVEVDDTLEKGENKE